MRDLRYGAATRLLAVAVECGEGFVGFVDAVVAGEIPGAFRGDEQEDDEWDWPAPLDGIADAVGPATGKGEAAVEDAGSYELAGGPAVGGLVCPVCQLDLEGLSYQRLM